MFDPVFLHHAYAFSQAGNTVLVVNPGIKNIEFEVIHPTTKPLYADDVAQDLANQGHLIAKLEFEPNLTSFQNMFNFVPSCVTVVKVATGVASYALTPKQLMRDLVKRGAFIYEAK